MNRADNTLRLAIIAHCLARSLHSCGNRRFRDDAAIPDGIDDLVLRHHPVAVLCQQQQEGEHLWFDMDAFAIAAQLESVRIELETPEADDPGYWSVHPNIPDCGKSP